MIENNTNKSRAMEETLSGSLNGSKGLSSSNVGPSQPVSKLQSESKFSNSDYNTTPSNDIISEFELNNILHGNSKWPDYIETPPDQSPVHVSSNPHTPSAQVQYKFQYSPLNSFDSNSNSDKIDSTRLRALLVPKQQDRYSNETNTVENNILKKALLIPHDPQSPDDNSTNRSTPSSNNSYLNEISAANTSPNNNNMLLKVCINNVNKCI